MELLAVGFRVRVAVPDNLGSKALNSAGAQVQFSARSDTELTRTAVLPTRHRHLGASQDRY